VVVVVVVEVLVAVIGVDRLEHIIRVAHPEFKYIINLEVL